LLRRIKPGDRPPCKVSEPFFNVKGIFFEPFRNLSDLKTRNITQTMYIKAHSVRLVNRNETSGIETEVIFCTLPDGKFPALLRKLTITNRGSVYYVRRDWNRAIADYEAVLRINPNHPSARNFLENARRMLGEAD
jgi:tetratricopeptide (TPR) repeat protein